ncbi:hypothetical protein [Burkholderia cenocepacia]|uniref:hypothetical protein n=1 Tax=Burkholderia cenocepacia TaxID=95486 RepID=UPI001B987288|nr:hypothetical protein [Burkholderia cenocepacia]MBR7969084.1 hypothetical protein [Burkholderia cenocepacia]
MGRPYNLWKAHEVEIVRRYWPSLMPMEDLLKLLPRHSESSITTYANKVLLLKRPTSRSAPGSPRRQPAWERVMELLKGGPKSQLEIAAALSVSRKRASQILQAHPGDVYIKSWRWPSQKSRAEALWALGNMPDAPEPVGLGRARKLAREALRTDPFMTALGMVPVPNNVAGRIVRNLV